MTQAVNTGLRRLVLRLLTEQRSFEEILEAVCAGAAAQAILLDKDARLLAHSRQLHHPDPIWTQILEEGGIPYQYFLEHTRLPAALWQLTRTRSPVCYRMGAGEALWLLMAPMAQGKALAGYVMICASVRSEVAELEEVALLLGRVYLHKYGSSDPPAGITDGFFVSAIAWELLASDAVTVSELVLHGPGRMGAAMGSRRLPTLRPPYLVAALCTADTQVWKGLSALGEELRDRAQELYFLVAGSHLLVLFVNVGRKREENLAETLNAFAAHHGLQCGISLPFDMLEHRRFHKCQALDALQVGRRLDPGARVHSAWKLYPELPLQAALDKLGADTLWRSDLQALAEHDRQHGTAYLETLAQYLHSGGSYTGAAQKLFVDRSTLGYRLAKIRSILGCDPDDPETACRLLLAITIRTLVQ